MSRIEFKPLINGIEYGWGDIVLNIGGTPVTGARAVKYKESQEKKNIYGAGRNPVARARGRRSWEASVTLLSSTVFGLQAAAPKGQITRIKPFPIVVTYQPEDGPLKKVTLTSCEFTDCEFDWKEGDLEKEITLPLVVSEVVTK